MNATLCSLLMVTVLLCAGCAKTPSVSSGGRSDSGSILEERPFVEGQPAPIPPAGFAWCLEKRDAVLKQVPQQVIVRPATSYYETVPARYETRSERVMVEPEQQRTVLVCPDTYKDVPERRLVEPATVEYRTVPAEYRWVDEDVLVVPERTEKVFVPARYETYQERVLTAPERTVRAPVPGCDKDGADVDCYAARTIPAEYSTITKKRLAQPASTALRTIPAQHKTMRVSKVVSPARVEQVAVPARYETVMKKVLDRPAQYRTDTTPARYTTIEKKVMVAPESQRLVEVPAKYGTSCRMEVVTPERLVWVLKRRPENSCPVPVRMAEDPLSPVTE